MVMESTDEMVLQQQQQQKHPGDPKTFINGVLKMTIAHPTMTVAVKGAVLSGHNKVRLIRWNGFESQFQRLRSHTTARIRTSRKNNGTKYERRISKKKQKKLFIFALIFYL